MILWAKAWAKRGESDRLGAYPYHDHVSDQLCLAPPGITHEYRLAVERPVTHHGFLDPTQISLEALLQIEVISLAKRPESRTTAAAAVYVITSDDIQRSGVTNLPEALRLAPGVQVARIDAHKWAIGVRGFASRLSPALLVLIDGRSVYSPLFAGVY